MKEQKKKEINYQAFFISGIMFLGAGAIFTISVNPGSGVALMGLGIVWMLIGVKNRYKVHKLNIKLAREPEMLENFLNNLKGEVISIIPNPEPFFLFYGAKVKSILIVEKIKQ